MERSARPVGRRRRRHRNLPPLRERRDEIPILADYLMKKYSVQYNKPYSELSQETMRLFMDYDWPGNIRELENLIKRAVVLSSEAPIRKEITQGIAMAAHRVHAPAAGHPPSARVAAAGSGAAVGVAAPATPAAPPTPAELAVAAAEAGNYSLKSISREAARQAERELILKMLQQTRWNRKETAEILGISYKALLYKIKENGLDKAS